MPEFDIVFKREFEETGSVRIEAEDEDDAKDQAETMLADDDGRIAWDNGQLENQSVDSVTQVDE